MITAGMFSEVRKEFNVRWPCVRMLAHRPIDASSSENFVVVLSVRNQLAVNIGWHVFLITQSSYDKRVGHEMNDRPSVS